MAYHVSVSFEISDSQASDIFHKRLDDITRGYHMENGVLMEEHATSHVFWQETSKTHPMYGIVVAALALKRAYSEKK